jgi:hypothetical protein
MQNYHNVIANPQGEAIQFFAGGFPDYYVPHNDANIWIASSFLLAMTK